MARPDHYSSKFKGGKNARKKRADKGKKSTCSNRSMKHLNGSNQEKRTRNSSSSMFAQKNSRNSDVRSSRSYSSFSSKSSRSKVIKKQQKAPFPKRLNKLSPPRKSQFVRQKKSAHAKDSQKMSDDSISEVTSSESEEMEPLEDIT